MAQFRVIGANRETGARMVLEFNADSKAAAERKATQQGMSVNRVEDITDGHIGHTGIEVGSAKRRVTGMHPVVKTLLLVAVLAALYFVVWPIVRPMIGR